VAEEGARLHSVRTLSAYQGRVMLGRMA
jgi:hypothetical protein